MPKRELPPVPNTLSDDPYAFEDVTDWNKVYSSSTDKQGHRESLRLNVSQGTIGMLHRLLAKHSHPALQTTSDLVRNFIYHGAEVFNRISIEDPQVTQYLKETLANVRREQITEECERTQRLVDDYASDCRAAWANSDFTTVRRYLIDMEDLVSDMREPYKAKLLVTVTEFNAKLINLI